MAPNKQPRPCITIEFSFKALDTILVDELCTESSGYNETSRCRSPANRKSHLRGPVVRTILDFYTIVSHINLRTGFTANRVYPLVTQPLEAASRVENDTFTLFFWFRWRVLNTRYTNS